MAEIMSGILYGFAKKSARTGSSPASIFLPDVRISSIGGHRSRTAFANFRPFIEPGMSLSLKTMRTSVRSSRINIASSAFTAVIASYPASSTKLIARARIMGSSSIMRTTGRVIIFGCLLPRAGAPAVSQSPKLGRNTVTCPNTQPPFIVPNDQSGGLGCLALSSPCARRLRNFPRKPAAIVLKADLKIGQSVGTPASDNVSDLDASPRDVRSGRPEPAAS